MTQTIEAIQVNYSLQNIEPKPTPIGLVSCAHLGGFTDKRRKRKNLSGTKGNAQGKMKLVTYCPECPQTNFSMPQSHPHAVVNRTQPSASCKNGHTWSVR